MTDPRQDDQAVVLHDDGTTETIVHVRRAPDGPHVRLMHRIRRRGEVTETRPFTISPVEISGFARLFASLRAEHAPVTVIEGTTLIGDDGYCRTEAHTWREDDGMHVRVTQHWRHLNGREASAQITGFRGDEISALADVFAQLRDEHEGDSVREFVRAVRLALAAYTAADDSEALDAADALADAVDSLLCQKLDRAAITAGGVIRCVCGDEIEQHDGVWLHLANPDIIGHDDEKARPQEDQ